MAINYVVSYTFSPSTTISSSQVNTNFGDNANTWTGLEAKTKSFSNLQVDATPSAATDVAIKSYVDGLMNYRRPVLVFNSTTVVNIESGIDGTSGEVRILFPDGNLRKDSTAGRVQCNLAQVAALSGAAQSGLRTGTVANGTWYAIYAVKVTDSSTNFVAVADTVFPVQANFATLNSNFGTNGWVYLGVIPNGDGSGSNTTIPSFVMCGNRTIFKNACNGSSSFFTSNGVRLATTGGATTLTYTYAAGSLLGSAQTPNTVLQGTLTIGQNAGTLWNITDAGSSMSIYINRGITSAVNVTKLEIPLALGIINNPGTSTAQDIFLSAFSDSALGVGANPLL